MKGKVEIKELSSCNKLWFSNQYIWRSRALYTIFRPKQSYRNLVLVNHLLKRIDAWSDECAARLNPLVYQLKPCIYTLEFLNPFRIIYHVHVQKGFQHKKKELLQPLQHQTFAIEKNPRYDRYNPKIMQFLILNYKFCCIL